LSDFSESFDRPPEYPLDLVLCLGCSLLQLKVTTPPHVLYTERYGYKSGINNTIKADLKDIVTKAMVKKPLALGDIVIDIGCNDGTLLSYYPNSVYRVGFEPVKKLAEEAGQYANVMYNEFFNSYSFNKKAKIITAISMFYDLDDPNKFVEDLEYMLDEDGIIVIQQNYVAGMLKQNAIDNVVHEHLEYYSLTSLEHLLNRHGLEVFDVEENGINGGSFRTYVRHMSKIEKMRCHEKDLKLDDPETYLDWSKEVKHEIAKLYKFIKKVNSEGKKVYLYGASTRGNTLIQYARLNNGLIKAAVERNPEKWGKKILSLQIPIISEEQARVDKPDYMLVLPWFFKDEFIKREREYLDGGGHFIFPLPHFEVV